MMSLWYFMNIGKGKAKNTTATESFTVVLPSILPTTIGSLPSYTLPPPHLDNLLVVMTILFGVDGFARKYESEAMKREGNNVVTHCHIWASE